MNNTDQILDKLFTQARRVQSSASGEAELGKGLENRILADWHRSRAEDSINLVPLFRWGFGFALTASLLIIGASALTGQANASYAPTFQVSTYAGTITP